MELVWRVPSGPCARAEYNDVLTSGHLCHLGRRTCYLPAALSVARPVLVRIDGYRLSDAKS